MPHPISIGLILLAVLGLTPSVRAGDPINWPLSKIAMEDASALRKTLLAQRYSQDELDFALMAAASKGRSEAALLLLTSGANPRRQVPPNGFSPVVVSIRENHVETLIVLLEHGGDPNETDRMGWRPLHHTIGPHYERPDAIRALLEHSAVVDTRDGLQRTALHRAAGFGHAESVCVLLEAGADPSLRERNGYSAIQRAILAGHRDIAELIHSYRLAAANLNVGGPKQKSGSLSLERHACAVLRGQP
ncbi:MAG: ankyrin repeat domain-containing protein [Nitrospiraceae bacterium]